MPKVAKPGRVPRMGFLGASAKAPFARFLDAFLEGLREHGWADGQNLRIDYHWADGRLDLLAKMQATRIHLALVVDEYGVVQGLMTPRDLLEAITGEWLGQNPAEDAWANRDAMGYWTLDGAMPIIEFKNRLQIDQTLPDEDKDRYNTVAGLFLSLLGRLPSVGEKVDCAGWTLQVLALDGRRIDRQLPVLLRLHGRLRRQARR